MIDKKVIQTYCMKNQLPELIALLKEEDKEDLYYSKFKERFIDRKKIDYDLENSIVVSILHQYEEYYVSVFYERVPEKIAKRILQKELNSIVGKKYWTMMSLEKYIKKLFENAGLYFIGNKTSGFHGPYVWKKTEKIDYEVEISSGVVQLPVFFMYDFLMNSWLDYISLGMIGTGGWSKKEGLYNIYSKYKEKIDKPTFQISFLKHEAQHNIDMRSKVYYMNSTVLEYRAKLTELVYYPNMELLGSFIEHAKNDKKLTHPQAQNWIIQDLSKLIFDSDYVDDMSLWNEKSDEIKSYSEQLLLGYYRCKKNPITATLRYWIINIFFK